MTRKNRPGRSQAKTKRRRLRRLVEHPSGLMLEVAEKVKPARRRKAQVMDRETVAEAAEAMTRRQLRHLRRRQRETRTKSMKIRD